MTRWRPGERVTTGEGASRPPLPDLPGFPAMRGYCRLRDDLGALAFRHVADVLRPPEAARPASFGTLPRVDGGFRVLDGVWLPGRGTLWQRVDAVCLGRVRAAWVASDDPRAAGAAAVVDTLDGLLRDEPRGLRQVLLWQLACLLRDGSGDPTAADAVALGVHREEAADLAAAVAAGFPGAGGPREAAERLGDVWPGRRLREAGRLAAQVRDPGGDSVLTGLLNDLRARTAEVARVVADAARTEEQGSAHVAALHWLVAARRAEDDPSVRRGLLRTATTIADDAAGDDLRVTAVEHHRAVHLMWPAAQDRPESVTYRLFRFPDGSPGETTEVRASVERDAPNPWEGGDSEPMRLLRDSDPPIGRPVRYAVVPQRRGVVADVPLVSSVIVITPEVTDLDVAVVPDGVRLRWRADPACVDVVARRTPADVSPARWVSVPCDRHGLLDVPLPVGEFRYEIRCAYQGPDGRSVSSRGLQTVAHAEEWPDPVTDLSARLSDEHDRVALAWRPPVRGRAVMVPWQGGPVTPGADVSDRTDLTVPDSDTDAPPALLTAVPEGSRLRVISVSVLGERAVAGAGLVVENPGVVRDLTVRRRAADRARVAFTWPDPAVLVLVTWQGDGHREERRVARSRFLADGHVELPVTEGGYLVTVSALCRPDALAVPAAAAVVDLAPMPPPTPPPAPPLLPLHGRWAPWRRWWAFRR